jgi:hypothetical protein
MKNIWFGLVKVEAINGNKDLDGAKGAYVSVAYVVENEIDFVNRVNETFASHDFKVNGIEEIQEIPDEGIFENKNPEKFRLIDDLNNGASFTWGDFHCW